MDKKETHMVVMRNTPAALGYDDGNENDGEPLSRLFLPSFFFLLSFHSSILRQINGRKGGRGEEENKVESKNGKPSKEKERNDSKREQHLEISTVDHDQGKKRGQARKYEN